MKNNKSFVKVISGLPALMLFFMYVVKMRAIKSKIGRY